jgi:ATP-binding cassette subfamily B protein/subfamily B ATP-binding cassette protein MsbA
MKNFLRILRYAWNYRGRLILSLVSALMAALLWGLMFTCINPVLSILESGDNLQTLKAKQVQKTEERIGQLVGKIENETRQENDIDKVVDPKVRDKLKRNLANGLAKLEGEMENLRSDLRFLLFTKKYIDQFMPTDPFQTLAWLFAGVVAGVALRGVFEFSQDTLVGSVVNRVLYDMRNKFYRNVLHLDVDQFGEQGTGEMMARFTNDMEMVGSGLKTLFGRVVGEPLKALSCVLFACLISWKLTLMFLILVPIAIFILAKVGRLMKRATRRLLERMSSIYKILQEGFLGIRIVKAFTMEPYERHRFKKATRDYYRRAMMVVRLEALASPMIELLGVVAVAAALLSGAYLVLQKPDKLFGLISTDQPLETPQLLQLYGLLVAIADPVRKLSSVYTRMQSGFAASDRIFAFMDRQPRVQANSQGRRLGKIQHSIEFRDICFSYEPGQPILTNVHLKVRAGETLAFVGKNGCGKTTLLGLLPRFYDPDHGSILIDGFDIRKTSLRSLRKQIGVVTQDAILFEDTIFNNIAYGSRHAHPEEVEAAARLANAHDFIQRLPQGYQTQLGEAGSKLSGGQRQRLALARALLRNPSLLILDEFTSQSDSEAEADIHRALRDFKRDRTVFVITHRLYTLEIADRIVVMDDKRIVATGTHAELLANCPTYQRLQEAHSQKLCA